MPVTGPGLPRRVGRRSGVRVPGGAGVPPVAPLVSDTFTDVAATDITAHAADTGGLGWTKHPTTVANTGVITTPGRLCSSGGTGLFFHTATPATANYSVEADVVPLTLAGTDTGPAGRMDATAATYYTVRANVSTNLFELQSVVAGVATVIGSFANTFVAGASYHVRLAMVGTAITVDIDGVQRISVTSSTVTAAGLSGCRLTGAAGEGARVHIDNLTVTPL